MKKDNQTNLNSSELIKQKIEEKQKIKEALENEIEALIASLPKEANIESAKNEDKHVYRYKEKKLSDLSKRESFDKPLIQIRDIKKTYYPNLTQKLLKKNQPEEILKGLNLDIYKGERLAIMGHNGCGKTTLSNIILGYIPANAGAINLVGKKNTSEFLRTVGIQFQKADYIRNWKIDDAIDFIIKLNLLREQNQSLAKWFYSEATQKKEDLINFFDLEKKRDVPIRKMSGGEQQKLNLILSLIKKPEVLILDEFTTGLDLTFKEKTIDFLDKYIKENNITLIVISHIKEEVERLAERIIIIHEGIVQSDAMLYDLKKSNISLTEYLNTYFVNGKLLDKFKPAEITKAAEESISYKQRSFKFENPFYKKYQDLSYNSDFLGKTDSNVNVSKEQKTKVDNSISAYNKLLYSGWIQSFAWLLPFAIFILSIILFHTSGKSSFTVTDLQTKFSALAAGIGVSASLFMVFIWGSKMFKIKSTMTLKRIEISNSNKNTFISYSLLASLFWFFVPFILMFSIICILNTSGLLYDGIISTEIYYINEYNYLDSYQVFYESTFLLKNINWGYFILSSLLTYLLTVGSLLMFMYLSGDSSAKFRSFTYLFTLILLVFTPLFMPSWILLQDAIYFQTESGVPIDELIKEITENGGYYYFQYNYVPTLNIISIATIFSNPINLMAKSFMSMGTYSVTSSFETLIQIFLSVFYSGIAIFFGLKLTNKWTN